MLTKIKKTIVIDKWLDEDLSKYLEDHLLYHVPHYYGQTSKTGSTPFYGTHLTDDPLNRFLIYKLEKTLNMKVGKFIMYFNVQHPGMEGEFHKDDVGTISCIYMVTKTATTAAGYFEIQCEKNNYCKIPFVKNRLVAFDSQLLHRGRAPTDGVRITLAFKTNIHEKK